MDHFHLFSIDFIHFWSTLFGFDRFYLKFECYCLFLSIFKHKFQLFSSIFQYTRWNLLYSLVILSDRVGSGWPSGQPGLALPANSVSWPPPFSQQLVNDTGTQTPMGLWDGYERVPIQVQTIISFKYLLPLRQVHGYSHFPKMVSFDYTCWLALLG